MLLLNGAFTALLLLVSGVSPEFVLPPTNLTVSCRNLDVTARWTYSGQQPHTRFMVHVRGAAGESENETAEHHFDLSHFIWESEERYMEVHAVTVTASQGGERSRPVHSESFTFNDLKTSNIKCKLSFPPVEVGVSDASVSFRNPLHFYKELQQAVKSDAAYFKFNVTTSDNKNVTGICPLEQEHCRHKFPFTEGGDKCVTLRGWLYDGSGIRFVVFNETGPICPDTSAEVPVLIALLCIVVLIVTGVTISICLTKSWTMTTEEPPEPKSLGLHPGHKLQYHIASKEDISAVWLMDKQTPQSPYVSSDDVNQRRGSDGSADKGSVGGYGEGGLLESSSQEQEPGYSGEDPDSADDSVKTECIMIELEEEDNEEEEGKGRSPYDCPHNLQLESDDEYRGSDYLKR